MNALELLQKNPDGSLTPKVDKGQRMLFVGKSGSGKSTAEVTFPKKLFSFDFDNRFKGAVKAVEWMGEEEFGKIDFQYFSPAMGFEGIDAKLNEIGNAIEARQSSVKTLGFASIGTLVALLALDSQKRRGVKGVEGGFKGKVRGKVEFLHPDDYNYVSTAFRLLMFNYIMPLNEMGVNTIFSGWIIDRYGKKPGSPEYAPSEVIGEKLVGPGNFVEEALGYFDEVYYFRRKSTLPGQSPRFTVEFSGSFARSALSLPPGEHEIGNKDFFQFWKSQIPTYNAGVK